MDSTNSLYTRITDAVKKRRIFLAIDLLRTLASQVHLSWSDVSAIDSVADSYAMLSRYAVAGAEDPQRAMYFRHISSEILRIADIARRAALEPSSPTLYFSTLRVAKMHPEESVGSLLDHYRGLYAKLSLAGMGNAERASRLSIRRELDTTADRIFNALWVKHPFTATDETTIINALTDQSLPSALKEMMLSSLMLGNMEYFDEKRIEILARAYQSATGPIEMRALTCMMISIWMSRDRLSASSPLASVLAAISECKSTWDDDLKAACLALVRTRDTQRVSQTLRDEIIPQMMKMKPDMMKDITDKDIPDISGLSADEAAEMLQDFNPEWEEVFEKSGLGDKLRALTEMQAEGADVMMGTFANLKSYPFFRDPSAWFTPFDASHSAIAETSESGFESLADIVEVAPGLCDSDKYSLMFSLQRLPSGQKSALARQLRLHEAQMSEMMSAELHPELYDRYRMLDGDVHDAYRFFNLFRRKGEFHNPFAGAGITLAGVELLLPYVRDAGALEPMSEFYFRKGYYSEALPLFSIIEADTALGTMPEGDLYQKIGYCHQAMGDFQSALDYYMKSELVKPDSDWTIRRIAMCSRKLGLHEQALHYYSRLSEREPDSPATALSVGHSLLALNRLEEARKSYYKAQFLSNSHEAKYLRPLAWCSFLSGDFDEADKLYLQMLEHALPSDWLNAAHVAMARKDYQEAARRYRSVGASADDLDAMVSADRESLVKAGVDPLMLDVVLDSVISGR